MNGVPIVMSQFSPPPVRAHFVQRRQLNMKLREISKYPVTLVYAGAGYGKSTALSLYSRSEENVCWYSISKNDDDFLPFFTKVVYSIRQLHPSFADSIEKHIDAYDGFISPEHIFSLAARFINEVVALKKKIVLVLDDFHHVQSVNEIKQWMLFLLEHLPANLQIILSSRSKPSWELFAAYKIKGDLYEITQEDLTLRPDEMIYLFEDIYDLKLSQQEMDHMIQLTEGWAIAFHLLAVQLQAGNRVKKLLDIGQKSLGDLFDYLASEVLSKQPHHIQAFLLQSSVLEVLDPNLCTEILKTDRSFAILAELANQNVFVTEAEGQLYRYHALFKVFLENHLQKTDGDLFVQLHKRAGEFFKSKGDIETALLHFQKIKDYEAVSNLLSGHGMAMLRSGRLQSLHDLLSGMPDGHKKDVPLLYFIEGEIERYRSDYERAESLYDRMIAMIPEYDPEHYHLLGLAFAGKARVYLDTIQPGKAERFVKQAIQLHEKAKAPKREMAKLYESMAENLLNFGEPAKAASWLERARSLDLPLEEGNLQARIYLRTGQLEKAKEVLLKRKKENCGKQKHLPQAHRETDILLAFIEAMMGNAEESRRLAEEGIRLGIASQSPFVEACGWMRLGHAVQLLEPFDAGTAEKSYQNALRIMEKIGVSRGMAEPYMGQALLLGMKKKPDQAKELALKGLAETEKVHDRWLSALIKISFGIVSAFHAKWADAKTIFTEAFHDMEKCGDQYGVMVSSFWLALVSLKRNEESSFHHFMAACFMAMERHGYDFFLKKRTLFGPWDMQMAIPLLIKAKMMNICPGYTEQLLKAFGIGEDIRNHPGYTLTVQTFGKFVVKPGSHEEEIHEWQREKAKELFALFVTKRRELLMKDTMFQLLWPGEPPEAADRKFKVTLNTLLKVLEPDRRAREDSFFIARKGSYYGLNPRAAVELDMERFEYWTSKGLAEKDPNGAGYWLEKGLALYKGEYLADLRHAAWCHHERERLQLLFLRGAEKMAEISVIFRDFDQSIKWCEKILQHDRTWEDAYRLMMYSYDQKNNRGQAIKWYEKCRTALLEELGVEPAQTTTDLYVKISG